MATAAQIQNIGESCLKPMHVARLRTPNLHKIKCETSTTFYTNIIHANAKRVINTYLNNERCNYKLKCL